MDNLTDILSQEKDVLVAVVSPPEIFLNAIQVINICTKRSKRDIHQVLVVLR